MQRLFAGVLIAALACVAVDALFRKGHSPESWALTCLCFWSSFLIARGPSPFSAWELRNVTWATASLISFVFLLLDGDLHSWADVYYFCGDNMRYCTADYRWNVRGWRKAVALWNFMLATAMGLQRLFIVLGLGGLLRGEETLTQESFISIAWRLIPYWLNNWEQQWGAECSSMIFELPHFALELLVVLPCIQILCARLRILAHPPLFVGGVEEEEAAVEVPPQRDERPHEQQPQDVVWAPDVLRYRWERRAGERRLIPRLKANIRPMTVILFVCCLAAMNAMVIPRLLELSVVQDERSGHLLAIERELQAVVNAGHFAELSLWYKSTGRTTAVQAPEGILSSTVDQDLAGPAIEDSLNPGSPRALDPVQSGVVGASSVTAWNTSGAESKVKRERALSSAVDSVLAHLQHLRVVRQEKNSNGTTTAAPGGKRKASSPAALQRRRGTSPLEPGARARLGVWITLFQPLLPLHWLESLQLLHPGVVGKLNPVVMSALQYAERSDSEDTAKALHSLANDVRAVKPALDVWEMLLLADEEDDSVVVDGALEAGEASQSIRNDIPLSSGINGNHNATNNTTDSPSPVGLMRDLDLIQTIFLAARAGGLDITSAPLVLRTEQQLKDSSTATEQVAANGASVSLNATTTSRVQLPNQVQQPVVPWLRERQAVFWTKQQPFLGTTLPIWALATSSMPPRAALRLAPLYRSLHKHARELQRMTHPDHVRLFPLLELALAVMRLSCERFFTLLPVWAAYLAFRDPPQIIQRLVVVIARTASVFQRAVLLTFPAVCWAYQAGLVFSTFVSFVFWTGPLRTIITSIRARSTSVQPAGWQPASEDEIERMGGNCAVCWGALVGQSRTVGRISGRGAHAEEEEERSGSSFCRLDDQEEERETVWHRWIGSRSRRSHDHDHDDMTASTDHHSLVSSRSSSNESLFTATSRGGGADSWHSAREEQSTTVSSTRLATATVNPEHEVDSAAPREPPSQRMGVAMALPCGHAYHAHCLLQWLQQCFSQGRMPTCPMCQASIQLEVRYHWPFGRGSQEREPISEEEEEENVVMQDHHPEGHGRVIPGLRALTQRLQEDFQNRFEPFPEMPPEQDIPFRA